MSRIATRLRHGAWILGAGLALAACTESRLHLSDDFGQALRQDEIAQVADPEARYKGVPPAGSNGMRAGLAQTHYEHNAVIPPASMTTSSVGVGGGSGGAGGGGGGGAPPGP
jgi:hypothetical protein